MPLLRPRLLLPCLVCGSLGVIGFSYWTLQGSTESTANQPSVSASAMSAASSPVSTPGKPVAAPDLACASEPIHQEALLWRKRVDALTESARQRRTVLRLEDANFDDADTAITAHPDVTDIPRLEQRAAQLAAELQEKSAQWSQLLIANPDEFQRTAPKDSSSCGTGIYWGLIQAGLDQIDKLHTEGASPEDPRFIHLETQLSKSRNTLVAAALYKERRELDTVRITLDELQDPP